MTEWLRLLPLDKVKGQRRLYALRPEALPRARRVARGLPAAVGGPPRPLRRRARGTTQGRVGATRKERRRMSDTSTSAAADDAAGEGGHRAHVPRADRGFVGALDDEGGLRVVVGTRGLPRRCPRPRCARGRCARIRHDRRRTRRDRRDEAAWASRCHTTHAGGSPSSGRSSG